MVGISEDEALNPQNTVEKLFAEKLKENVSVVEARRLLVFFHPNADLRAIEILEP